jgi:mono/diheme cytochrome c family protein
LGFSHYRGMCQECHGGPGVDPEDLAKGLNPAPPSLNDAAKDFTASELFWTTKNGIRMTGMPAWAPTHSDEVIWDIVAFLETLPGMSPADYQALTRKIPPAPEP